MEINVHYDERGRLDRIKCSGCNGDFRSWVSFHQHPCMEEDDKIIRVYPEKENYLANILRRGNE